eukprot:206900-Pelagomonas_calceolata.AAC.4
MGCKSPRSAIYRYRKVPKRHPATGHGLSAPVLMAIPASKLRFIATSPPKSPHGIIPRAGKPSPALVLVKPGSGRAAILCQILALPSKQMHAAFDCGQQRIQRRLSLLCFK